MADLFFSTAGHIVTGDEMPAYIRHPMHGGRLVRCVPLAPKGHDGATIDRFPAVELGHMKES